MGSVLTLVPKVTLETVTAVVVKAVAGKAVAQERAFVCEAVIWTEVIRVIYDFIGDVEAVDIQQKLVDPEMDVSSLLHLKPEQEVGFVYGVGGNLKADLTKVMAAPVVVHILVVVILDEVQRLSHVILSKV